ncbi:MAG TPA: hypothetical protein VFC42_02265 [Methylomirabilota bacterium]|nr:hypothetical protein [Methylomirabilota bacterium]
MGGPWRERGFDPAALRPPRPRREPRAEAIAREGDSAGLTRVVLAYIAATIASFGLMLALLQGGW